MAKPLEIATFREFCDRSSLVRFDDFRLNSERPDFLSWDGHVGIELVEYHRDAGVSGRRESPRRSWEMRLQRLIDEARTLFARTSEQRANVYFFPHRHSDANDCALANGPAVIAAFVVARLEDPLASIPAALSSVVEAIDVSEAPAYQAEPEWGVAMADLIDANTQAIQNILDVKERRVSDYRRTAGEVWLLVHGSRMPLVGASLKDRRWSSCGHVTDQMGRTAFRSTFDRVFYFDLDRATHIRLRLTG